LKGDQVHARAQEAAAQGGGRRQGPLRAQVTATMLLLAECSRNTENKHRKRLRIFDI
jgi:hypothetical protein